MPLTYQQVYDLRKNHDWPFKRTVSSIGALAVYYSGLGAGETVDQKAFAARVLPGTNAEIEADYVLWAVCFDPALVNDDGTGDTITDDQFRAVVETKLGLLGRIQAV